MLALPEDLREEAHLMELESMGYTIVHNAIPLDLLRRLKICHEQACQRIRECKPEADWSWESDNEGVVDYWRLYALDPVYEELLTLPSIYNICQRAIVEGRGGAGMEPHPAGPILVHEMAQHAPGHTPGGQQWCAPFGQYRARHGNDDSASDTLCCGRHQDGGPTNPSLRCTFTLNDLAPDGGGTIALSGSHTPLSSEYGQVLNSLEPFEYKAPRDGRSSAPFDRSANRPHAMPNAVTQHGPAGSCMINWTSIWHTRPPNFTDQARDVIWQIFTRKQPISASEAKHGGRRQHHQPRPYVEKVQATGSEQLKALIGEPERWGFETLTEDEIARTTAAEPLWPDGRPDTLLASRDDTRASKL